MRYQTTGYLVVLKPSVAALRHRSTCDQLGSRFADYLQSFRKAVPSAGSSSYRGLARYPVDRGWHPPEGSPEQRPNARAELLMRRLLGPNLSTLYNLGSVPYNQDLLPDLASARRIREALDEPDDHECIEVSRQESPVPMLAGIDVGYWGMSHFSALCDSLIWPTWHPPDPSDFGTLAAFGGLLNEHGLFASRDAARSFREWYVRQSWAEEEVFEGEIRLVQVGLPGPRHP